MELWRGDLNWVGYSVQDLHSAAVALETRVERKEIRQLVTAK